MADDFGFIADGEVRDDFGFVPLVETRPGEEPSNPLQEQHEDITDADRFHIMQLGGGGEAAARYLRDKGLEVDHQGGMYFSVRKPGGKWKVLDPSDFEPFQDITDIVADVGSIAAMGAGGAKGATIGASIGTGIAPGPGTAIGGVLGAIGGAGLMGGASQLARAGYGKVAGLDQTLPEVARDVGYETAFGAGSEAGGMLLGAGIRAGSRVAGRALGGRLGQTQREIMMAEPQGQMRSVWEIAEMEYPTERLIPHTRGGFRGPWLRRDVPKRYGFDAFDIPPGLEKGRPVPGRSARMRSGYRARDLRDKLIAEWVEEIRKDMINTAGNIGADVHQWTLQTLLPLIGTKPRLAKQFRRFLQTGAARDPEIFFQTLTKMIADGFMDSAQQKVVARKLASLWGLEHGSLTDSELMKVMRRVMADDDFVYREAGRKLGIKDAFSPDKDLQELADQIWQIEAARAALGEAGAFEPIEAGFKGGSPRLFQKEPPFSESEAHRSARLTPFIQKEAMEEGVPPGTPPRKKYPEPQDPLELMRQFEQINESEYMRRVFGEIPELGGGAKVHGGPPYFGEPMVDFEARSRQMFERRLGEPWEKAKGRVPKDPSKYKGYPWREWKPGVSHGGPQGGVIPRAEAVDFWRYLSLSDLTSLKIGGREIPLTQPQGELVKRVLYTMAVTPRARWLNGLLQRIARTLQIPKRALKAALQALGMRGAASFMSRPGVSGGAAGAVLGAATESVLAGGLGGAAVGATAEFVGAAAAALGRRLMRQPDARLLGKLIRKAAKRQSSRAVDRLRQALSTLDAYGEDAFRAMIYDAMHEPEVRQLLSEGVPE